MIVLNPEWKILTIGDGDLSFSAALSGQIAPSQLTATVYDNKSVLANKYGLTHFKRLTEKGVNVQVSVDVLNPDTWDGIELGQYDVVIFQFPLIPSDFSASEFAKLLQIGSTNTLNRWLLRSFLKHCFKNFLSPTGARLAVITSKDVKPYRQWNIETSLCHELDINYLGRCEFDITKFDGYQVRNVDRDKFVKDTQGYSYVFSDRAHAQLNLELPDYCTQQNYCAMCRVGPIDTELDWQAHFASKRHRQMTTFEAQWQDWRAEFDG
ncbi:MAG: class I SAM-dependent methyltransferase [Psychrobium sp.]